jgi:hypothetical protein
LKHAADTFEELVVPHLMQQQQQGQEQQAQQEPLQPAGS